MPRTCPLPCLQANQQTLPSAKPAGTAAPKHQQCQQPRRTPAGTLHSTAALPLHPFPPCSPPAARSPPPPAPAPSAASSFSFSASPPRRPAPPRLHARSAAQRARGGFAGGLAAGGLHWAHGSAAGLLATTSRRLEYRLVPMLPLCLPPSRHQPPPVPTAPQPAPSVHSLPAALCKFSPSSSSSSTMKPSASYSSGPCTRAGQSAPRSGRGPRPHCCWPAPGLTAATDHAAPALLPTRARWAALLRAQAPVAAQAGTITTHLVLLGAVCRLGLAAGSLLRLGRSGLLAALREALLLLPRLLCCLVIHEVRHGHHPGHQLCALTRSVPLQSAGTTFGPPFPRPCWRASTSKTRCFQGGFAPAGTLN